MNIATLTQSRTRWSDQQEAIFDWFRDGAGNLVVRARAGCGKTTTILEACGHAPERNIVLCAFNKRIAQDLQQRVTGGAQAKTLHGLGFSFVRRNRESVRVNGSRCWRLAEAEVGDQEPKDVLGAVAKIATMAKDVMPFVEAAAELVDLAYDFDLVLDEYDFPAWPAERLCEYALRVMIASLEDDGEIDFADMIYLPLRLGWARGVADLVVVDEAQDMNAGQLELAQRSCRRGGRIAIVGDDRQALYAFRGADAGAIDRMKAELNATELGLTTTYRCPKRIVEIAARLVPDFCAAPTAPEGEVRPLLFEKLGTDAQPGDFVLSRVNAPLARVCLSFLRAGVRARIEGRDIGRGLVKLIEKFRAPDVPEFLERLGKWEEREVKKAITADRDARADYVRDQAETLRELSDDVRDLDELCGRVETLFAPDGRPQVVCSTVHRAKGLESERVFVLDDTLYKGSDEQAEANIEYVAVTRAKRELVRVKGLR